MLIASYFLYEIDNIVIRKAKKKLLKSFIDTILFLVRFYDQVLFFIILRKSLHNEFIFCE